MSFTNDLRFAIRGWSRSPGYAFAALATLALGIGANTAVFSVTSGVLLRPLPFADPDRVVQITEIQPGSSTSTGTSGPVYVADFLEFRDHSRLIEGLVTFQVSSRNLWGLGEPERLSTVGADRGLFTLLGASPIAGRTFHANDPMNVAVVSASFWRAHFGGDPAAIGQSLNLEGQPYTLLGVMPDEFQFPNRAERVDLWIPQEPVDALRALPNRRLDAVVARLRPGVSVEAARQELSGMEGPRQAGRQVTLRPMADVVAAPVRDSLLVLLGAVGMVLLVACVNVANLLLARTAAREREISIRAALGAGRWRLIRQFLTESLLLSFAGGAAGLLLGILGRRALVNAAAEALPRAQEIALDWRVFAFLLAACAISGIAFGLAPALSAARGGSAALRSRGAAAVVRDGLVVVEVALAFVLLAGAGLLLRTFLNLQRTDLGLRPDNVLTVHMVVSGGAEAAAIEDRVSRIPGVRAAGFVSMLPLQHTGWSAGFQIPGQPGIRQTELRYVTPGYFKAMGIPVRAGREFTAADRDPAPQARVIVVNEALARQHLAGRNPVGARIDRGAIVGVAGDVRHARLSETATPVIYYTMAQNFAQIRNNGSTLVVSGHAAVEGLTAAIRAAVREVSPTQALFRVSTMSAVVETSLAAQRLYTWLLTLFAAIGALLAVAGIYGVVAYLVALRTREFGIRMALGADSGRVLGMVMRRGALVVALGLLLGIAGAAMLTRLLGSILYGVTATDPLTFLAMAGLLALVALAACLIPATRAARVDPAVALRVE
jgi:predicted permease